MLHTAQEHVSLSKSSSSISILSSTGVPPSLLNIEALWKNEWIDITRQSASSYFRSTVCREERTGKLDLVAGFPVDDELY